MIYIRTHARVSLEPLIAGLVAFSCSLTGGMPHGSKACRNVGAATHGQKRASGM